MVTWLVTSSNIGSYFGEQAMLPIAIIETLRSRRTPFPSYFLKLSDYDIKHTARATHMCIALAV